MIAQQVYNAFQLHNVSAVAALSEGLINSSYKVSVNAGGNFFLQKINTGVFTAIHLRKLLKRRNALAGLQQPCMILTAIA